jgi:hypothetical protein
MTSTARVGEPAHMLWEVEEIKQLKARYFRGIDTEDWELFGSCFTDDVRTKLPGGDWREGLDAILSAVVKHHTDAEVVTVHHGHMPEIRLTAQDAARGTWSMFDFVDRIWKDDHHRDAFVGYGHYHERYRKVDGEWRISQMELTRLRVDWPSPETLPPFPHRGAAPVDVHRPSAAQ